MTIGLIIGGIALILGGVVIIILLATNKSPDGNVVERFFKQTTIIYWILLCVGLVVSGIGLIAKGATSGNDTPAAHAAPAKHK